MFGGKDVVLDGEGTGTIDGNGQVSFDHGLLPPLFLTFTPDFLRRTSELAILLGWTPLT